MSNLEYIVKRDGSTVAFDPSKIRIAISKAVHETEEIEDKDIDNLVDLVLEKTKAHTKNVISVEDIQDLVEEVLIESQLIKTAKAYIIYRELRSQDRKPNIFKKRLALKPHEYPDLAGYVDAIRQSYWIHTEFNYTSDIQDFMVNVNPSEQNAIKNAMLAIAQVEVSVKTFWGDIYKRMPKPEVGAVGYTFAESEVRHSDAYSHLLELLGLNHEFSTIKDIPDLMQRVSYLDKSVAMAQTGEDRDYALAVLLFSLFIEHVSLFSQFLIIMSFNKYQNLFKGISNAIEATSKEEQIHGLFGIDLINIIREENPQWFDKDMEKAVYDACHEAYASEEKVIDWIYEDGDLDFMPKDIVKEFVKNRLNNSLESIGYDKIFDIDEEKVILTDWFDDEVIGTKHLDFFNKRSINYTKHAKSITSDDLF